MCFRKLGRDEGIYEDLFGDASTVPSRGPANTNLRVREALQPHPPRGARPDAGLLSLPGEGSPAGGFLGGQDAGKSL